MLYRQISKLSITAISAHEEARIIIVQDANF